MIRYLPEYENNGFFDPYLLHQLLHDRSGNLRPHFVKQTENLHIPFSQISQLLRKLGRVEEFKSGPEALESWEKISELLRWHQCEFSQAIYKVRYLKPRETTRYEEIEVASGSYRVKLHSVIDGSDSQEVRLIIRPHRHTDQILDFDKKTFISTEGTYDNFLDQLLSAQQNLFILEFNPSSMTISRRLNHRIVSFTVNFSKLSEVASAKARAERFLPSIFSPAFFTSELDLSAEKVTKGDSFGRYPIEELRKRFKDALELIGQAYFEQSEWEPSTASTKSKKRVNKSIKAERELSDQSLADQIKTESSRLIFRLLILFAAESKGYLVVPGSRSPIDPNRSKGLALLSPMTIRQIAAKMVQSRFDLWQAKSTLLWDSIWALFKECQFGLEEGDLKIPAFNGQLFEPDRLPKLSQIKLTDKQLAPIIDSISRVDIGRKVTEFCDYSNLRVNHLGEIYQWLLEFDAKVLQGNLVSVQAKKGDLDFWMTTDEARALEIPKENQKPLNKSAEFSFKINPKGTVRQKTGTHFTQAELADQIAFEGLHEILQEAEEKKDVERILTTSVLEPALGSAGVLSAALRLMGEAVFKIQYKNGDHLAKQERELAMQRSKRRVLERCLYGVDRMVDAVELARSALWLEVLSPELPLPFLDQRLRTGDSLVGTWFLNEPKFTIDDPERKDKPSWLYPNVAAVKKLWNDKSLKANFTDAGRQFESAFQSWRDWASPFAQQDDLTRAFKKQLNTYLETRKKYLTETQSSEQVEAQLETARASIHEKLAPNRVRSGELVPLFRLKDKDFERELYQLKIYKKLRTLADLCSSLWFWPPEKAGIYPTQPEYRTLVCKLLGLDRKPFNPREREQLRVVLELGSTHQFFHWELEFPELFTEGRKPDVVIGNPPWDKVKLSELDYFGKIHPFSGANKQWKEPKLRKIFEKYDPEFLKEWAQVDLRDKQWSTFIKSTGHYGDLDGTLDLYRPFTYLLGNITQTKAAFLLPQSLWINDNAQALREYLFNNLGWKRLIGYWNKKKIFPGIAQVSSFGIVTSPISNTSTSTEVAFRLETMEEGKSLLQPHTAPVFLRKKKFFKLSKKELEKISPNLSMPELRRPEDYDLLVALSKSNRTLEPLLEHRVQFGFHLTNALKEGLVSFEKSSASLPVWKGGHFHVWKPYFQEEVVEVAKQKWKTNWVSVPEKLSKDFRPRNALWASKEAIQSLDGKHKEVRLVWRDIASATNSRTLISCLIPSNVTIANSAYGLKVADLGNDLPLIVGVFGSLVLDAQVRLFGAMHVNVVQLKSRFIPDYSASRLWDAITECILNLHSHESLSLELTRLFKKDVPSQERPRSVVASELNGLVAAAYYHSTKGAFGETELRYILDNHFPAVFNSETQDKLALAEEMRSAGLLGEDDDENEAPDRGIPDPLSKDIIIKTFKEWTREKK